MDSVSVANQQGHSPASLGLRLTSLWNEFLSQTPPSGTADLWKEHLRIRRELDALKLAGNPPLARGRQTAETEAESGRMARLPPFLAWCSRMGVVQQSAGLEVKLTRERGLALVTSGPIHEGQIAVSVPRAAIFSSDQAEEIETLKNLLQNDELLLSMENVSLAMSVAHEVLRGDQSPWAPYFDILPPTFQTPIFYTEHQMQALKPSPVFEDTLYKYRSIARQFVYFSLRILSDTGIKAKKHLFAQSHVFAGSPFSLHNFSFDFYRWCVSIVSTRINIVPSRVKCAEDGSPKMIPGLIPLIDLANHAHFYDQPGLVYFEPETEMVRLQVNRSLDAGQELFIHYGNRSNGKFLLHNGFVPEQPNPNDQFELKIGLPCSSPHFRAKVDLLERKGILPAIRQKQSFIFALPLCPEPNADVLQRTDLWQFARIFVANKEEELEMDLDSSQPSAVEVEMARKAAKFLADRFQLLIRSYGTQSAVKLADEGQNDEQKQKEEEKGKEEEEDNDNNDDGDGGPLGAIRRLKQAELALLADYAHSARQMGARLSLPSSASANAN